MKLKILLLSLLPSFCLAGGFNGTSGGGGVAILPLPAGASNYIQNTETLQAGTSFYVSSGTVNGPLTINSNTGKSVVIISSAQVSTAFSYTNNYNAFGNAAIPFSISQVANTNPTYMSMGTSNYTINFDTAGHMAYTGSGQPDQIDTMEFYHGQNANEILEIYNNSGGSSASSELAFGDNSSNRVGYIRWNGTGNTSGGGAQSMNIVSNAPSNVGVIVIQAAGYSVTLSSNGVTLNGGPTFGTLGSPVNGTISYCSDCTVTTPATCVGVISAACVCAGSGSGAFAKRLNGSWYCN